jgi:Ca-activated chloride channel family protein
MTATLHLTATADHPLGRRSGGTYRHVLVQVQAASDDVRATDLDLAIALDTSGSMSGSKIETARRAALGIVEALTERDHLAIATFSNEALVVLPRTRMDAEGRQRAALALRGVHANGGTNLSEGWLLAVDALARHLRPEAVTRALLLSDGQANAGITDVRELATHARALRERGISTTAVGIGAGYDSELLQQIASEGGGQLHDAELDHELLEVLRGELAELRGIAVRDATLRVACPEGVRVEVLGDLPATRDGRVHRVPLGSLGAAARRDVCLRVKLPAGNADDPPLALELSVEGTPAHGGAPVSATTTCAFRLAASDVRAAVPANLEVIARVATVWHATLVRQAMALNRAGRARELRAAFDLEIPRFERYVRALPAFLIHVQALRELARRADRRWDEQTRKSAEVESWKTSRSMVDHRAARRRWDPGEL